MGHFFVIFGHHLKFVRSYLRMALFPNTYIRFRINVSGIVEKGPLFSFFRFTRFVVAHFRPAFSWAVLSTFSLWSMSTYVIVSDDFEEPKIVIHGQPRSIGYRADVKRPRAPLYYTCNLVYLIILHTIQYGLAVLTLLVSL